MIKVDDFGPERVIQVSDRKTGLYGFLVIDNTILGPGKGGIRLARGVTEEEVFGLARAMTWKNSMAGLPFGGAKSGIAWDGKTDKNLLMKSFARALKPFIPEMYVAGPDMNTGEEQMKVFAEEIGINNSATGKPSDMGGLPHELGSTGFGVAESTEVATKYADIDVQGATIAIEGFGNVGTFTSKFLSEKGMKIIAVSDSKGVIYNEEGLDIEKLIKVKSNLRTVTKYDDGEVFDEPESLFGMDVDIIIPGARPNVINDGNKKDIKAKLIVEAGNIPIPIDIEEEYHENNILVVPDFVANAGGVISSYVEYIGGNEKEMFKMVKEKVRENTKKVMEKTKNEGISPRDSAIKIAKERVLKAMK
jgi:glutamate dehydrogenase (NAD(P)+)